MLIGKGRRGKTQLIESQTVEALVARHRVDMVDETFGTKIDWGLGVMVNASFVFVVIQLSLAVALAPALWFVVLAVL